MNGTLSITRSGAALKVRRAGEIAWFLAREESSGRYSLRRSFATLQNATDWHGDCLQHYKDCLVKIDDVGLSVLLRWHEGDFRWRNQVEWDSVPPGISPRGHVFCTANIDDAADWTNKVVFILAAIDEKMPPTMQKVNIRPSGPGTVSNGTWTVTKIGENEWNSTFNNNSSVLFLTNNSIKNQLMVLFNLICSCRTVLVLPAEFDVNYIPRFYIAPPSPRILTDTTGIFDSFILDPGQNPRDYADIFR